MAAIAFLHFVRLYDRGRMFLEVFYMGIRFNNGKGSYGFTEPLRSFPSLAVGGIYAVLAYDKTWSPKPYRVLYFGKAKNLSERVCGSHEKYWSWKMEAGYQSALFYSFMFVTSEDDRTRIESELIAQYGPPCNDKGNLYKTLFGV
jgi:hypothetical protein